MLQTGLSGLFLIGVPTCLLVLALVPGHLVCVYYQPGVLSCVYASPSDGMGDAALAISLILTTAHSPHVVCHDRSNVQTVLQYVVVFANKCCIPAQGIVRLPAFFWLTMPACWQ